MSAQILQWGCGSWGVNVLRDLHELGARVKVLARSEETARRAREGGAEVVTNVAEADGVDGVVVVTPAAHHAEAIRSSAVLGCPIFCEKPLVTDPADEVELTELCGERLFVMHKWRWHPGIERLAELAADGTLGELEGVRSTRLDWGSFHPGADALDTAASHDLSIGFGILGSIPPVAAASGTPDPRVAGGWAEASLLFADRASPRLAVEVSTISAHSLRRTEVTGTLGSAVLPEPEAEAVELLVHDGDLERAPRRERLPLESEWPLLRELRDFVAHCLGGPPPRATAAEGFAVVRAIAEARALMRSEEAP
jgi:predicted dehydrogenase